MKLFCFLLLGISALQGAPPSFHGAGATSIAWSKLFLAVNIPEAAAPDASILLLDDSSASATELAATHTVLIEGTGALAKVFGIESTRQPLSIRHIVDVHGPEQQIVWTSAVATESVTVPADFTVFAKERWKNAPVLAGKRTAHGAILWTATDLGPTGMERYPYILQALSDLGVEPVVQTNSLWAFFDASYRIRADTDYLAQHWRAAGISVLHVAAWHNMEPDIQQDEYLQRLIASCHRHAILVYAWVELPHVSEKFWADHPEWREKTGAGQDAQLDWRKLMNLQSPACHDAVAAALTTLLKRFDWDGVNLAELYFESLEGAANPARFTPFNDDVRAEFRQVGGFDPALLFDSASPYLATRNAPALRKFLDFRAVIAARMQSDWLEEMKKDRKDKPYLDVVLTHIDDRLDPAIRDELGADVARALLLVAQQKSTLLVEDPANLWNLGADRYSQLAEKYRALKPDMQSVAIDINVVDRYQDVYPTRKQTGGELFELVHEAAQSFGHVAIYFENSIEKQDLQLLPAAAVSAAIREASADSLEIKATEMARVLWHGPADLDGRPWPLVSGEFVLAPAGTHRVSPSSLATPVTLSDFNGQIRSAYVTGNLVKLAYASTSRAIATLGSPVSSIELDNKPYLPPQGNEPLLLPAGQHVLTLAR